MLDTPAALLGWFALFALSLLALVKAADVFTRAAARIGAALGVPPFIVGVTIVAVGTSLPELASSILAVLAGSSEIVVGNVVGSNVTNIFLVLGITVLIQGGLETRYDLVHVDLPFLIASAFLLALTAWDGAFTLFEALLCLAAFAVYSLYGLQAARKGSPAPQAPRPDAGKVEAKTILLLLGSAFVIYLGARYVVESIVRLSGTLGIGTEVVAAVVLALGTSLPELAVTVAASRRGEASMAVGNILGSNVFNALAVMGVSGVVGRLVVPHTIVATGLPLLLAATLLYLFIIQDRQVTKWEGLLLLILYVFFVGRLLGL